MDFETILQRMLDRVPDTFDKREGSVIYDALAPAAYELAVAYADMEKKRKNTFAGTADRDGLIECCAEIGITPHEATYATRKGLFTPSTLEIKIGERFNFDDLNFIVSEKLAAGEYALVCETAGAIGNYGTGRLIPINYINGLETAMLVDVLIYGEEEESTEDLRQRYFDTLPTFTIDGNLAQYRKWCKNYPGVGKFKLFPLWNGKNTVKVSILSADNTAASDTLISDMQEYLDPPKEVINDDVAAANYPQGRGLGNGQAPIGAVVTVTTATEKPINLNAALILKEGYTKPIGLEEGLKAYFDGVNYSRDFVSYIAIGAIFQTNDTIDSVVQLTMNGGQADIPLATEEIAALGTLDWTVV